MRFSHVLAFAGAAAAYAVPVDTVTYVATPVPYSNSSTTVYPVIPTSKSYHHNGTITATITATTPSVPTTTPTEPPAVTGAAAPQKMQGSLAALMVLVAAVVVAL
ncbi:hypothetical protein G7Z17_g9558 [Cylindrodendrum hubeiense]|uniref:Arabinogalactan-like protein n=1 Tax=Cylindrodendrum hubeiense TaxID=595255 RepID=A0A9P5L810_9HYPO|nr:hypothetical protein G7Z17_g9558 [Cylindrodendrum hubeiense]